MSIIDNSHIAFAGLCSDIGKIAERGNIDGCNPSGGLSASFWGGLYGETKYGRWSAKSMDVIKQLIPNIKQDDFILNQEYLQNIIFCANQIASGVQYGEYLKTINDTNSHPCQLKPMLDKNKNQQFVLPILPISGKSIFPQSIPPTKKSAQDIKQDYEELWGSFTKGLKSIPESQRENFNLWLSHFESLYMLHSACVPFTTVKGENNKVSLYDHSKVVSALSVALHQYYKDNTSALKDLRNGSVNNDEHNKAEQFLIIQGDFMGIQEFIFGGKSESHTNMAKLLRGKSFYVSLLTELACLRVIEELELPATSKLLSASGKFIIIAGNTAQNREKITELETEISKWFLDNIFGLSNIVIASKTAGANDFLIKGNKFSKLMNAGANDFLIKENKFSELMKNIHKDLDIKKHQSYRLFDEAIHYSKGYEKFKDGCCKLNEHMPVECKCKLNEHMPVECKCEYDDMKLSCISRDQIVIGKNIAKGSKIIVSEEPINEENNLKKLIFGFNVSFADDKQCLYQDDILRIWDFSLPQSREKSIWNNYAKLFINGYVPIINESDKSNPIYKDLSDSELNELKYGDIKPFNFIAMSDMKTLPSDNSDKQNDMIGIKRLAIIKGDVDNLGKLFKEQSKGYTLTGMAGLSRQVDMFFTVYLPTFLAETSKYRDCYTVFAGGDDFFLVGPWHSMQGLIVELRKQFSDYVCDDLTFSVGIFMCDEKTNLTIMGEMGEKALEKAKSYRSGEKSKNAVCIFDKVVSWDDFKELKKYEEKIFELDEKEYLKSGLSTSYVHSMLGLTEMVENSKENPNDAMWLSRQTYQTAKYIQDNVKNEENLEVIKQDFEIFLEIIKKYKSAGCIPLTNYLYSKRHYNKGN